MCNVLSLHRKLSQHRIPKLFPYEMLWSANFGPPKLALITGNFAYFASSVVPGEPCNSTAQVEGLLFFRSTVRSSQSLLLETFGPTMKSSSNFFIDLRRPGRWGTSGWQKRCEANLASKESRRFTFITSFSAESLKESSLKCAAGTNLLPKERSS